MPRTYGLNPAATEWAIANPQAAHDAIASVVDHLAALEDELTLLVGLAREGGWSWGPVGEALGMTRQGAQRAYKGAQDRLDRLNSDAVEHDEAAAELRRLRRKLSVRDVRVSYEVSNAEGFVSRHYVEARADEAARRCGGTVERVELRAKVRNGRDRCRTCKLDLCVCGFTTVDAPITIEAIRERAATELDEPSF